MDQSKSFSRVKGDAAKSLKFLKGLLFFLKFACILKKNFDPTGDSDFPRFKPKPVKKILTSKFLGENER